NSVTNTQSSQKTNNETITGSSQLQSQNTISNNTMNPAYLAIGVIFVIVLPAIAIIIVIWKIKKLLAKRKSAKLQKEI
ncbi:MAG: hypothetical protein KGL95_11300, partial [Patescibacteria group bacterium]|nr:hypothetical protein [Patescibacteria group bacterium]